MSPATAPLPVAVAQAQEFERIYREYAPLVYRTAWGVLGRREDAEDVLQTVFLKLLRRECPPDLGQSPKAYLYKAAVTVSLDLLKARRRRPVLVEDFDRLEVPAASSDPCFDEAMYQQLVEAIAQLSAEAAEIVLLRYMQNKSVAEIASSLGVSRTVVAVRLFRSRARLRKLLRAPSEKQS